MNALSSTGVDTDVDAGVEPLEGRGIDVSISERTGFLSGCFDSATAGLFSGNAGCIFAMVVN